MSVTLLTEWREGFAFMDPEVGVRRLSRPRAEMTGPPRGEQVGHPPAEVWPPALAASAESAVRKVLADGMPVRDGLPGGVRHGRQAEAGQDAQIALSWFAAHGPDGTVTGGTMIAQDVAGESASAEAVRRSRERDRSLVQAGNQVGWVTNQAGEVSEDSPEWRRRGGRSGLG